MGNIAVSYSDMRKYYLHGMLILLVVSLLSLSAEATTTDGHVGSLTHQFLSDEPGRPECWNFTHGNPRRMSFYSPSYPENYPNDIECVHRIEAPRLYEIHLDFREKFIVESSDDCTYDFLEIRDGPFAYSPLIGRYCGNEFPPYIKSTSRFLWIRFKSDENVGKDGFAAVYSYVKKKDYNQKVEDAQDCRKLLDYPGINGFLNSRIFPLINSSYNKPVSCTWEIQVPPQSRIRLSEISLNFAKPGDCNANAVEVYEKTTSERDRGHRLCSGALTDFQSTSNVVYVRIYGSNYYRKPDVSMMYTVFHTGTCDQYDEMSCDNMCINNRLICDGRNNCPNRQDERGCNTAATGSTDAESGGGLDLYVIVSAVVGGFIFTIIVIGICLSCRYNRDKKRKEREARKHASGIELSTTPSANTTLVSKKGGLPASYYSLPRKGGGNPKDYHRNSLTSSIQTPSEGEYTDQHSDPGNYKRYMMTDQTYLDDETSPCPSLYNQGPVLTTIIERHDVPPQTNIDGTYSWGGYGWKPQQHVLDARSPVGSPPSLSENLAKLAQYTSPKNFPNIPESKYYNPESKYEMYPDPRYLIGKEYKMKYGGTGGQEQEISSPEQHRQKQQKLKSQHPDITRDLEVS